MIFDPFSDRTARNIRNSLSSAFVSELVRTGDTTVTETATRWLARRPAPVYQTYIDARRQQYAQLLGDIRSAGIDSPQRQAIVLWNAGLYFELHELLETIWLDAPEPERSALKGWIQAAGACVHYQRGKPDAALGLAARARTYLRAGSTALAFIANLEEFIDALEDLSQLAAMKLVDKAPEGS